MFVFKMLVFLVVLFVVFGQSIEIISMSTPQCDPTTDDCSGSSCSDEVPPGMTLSCDEILSNDLCNFKSVTQGNYCQQSCGTCGGGSECFTTRFGCKCLRNWRYQSKNYSGCANPDGDSFGSWCQIEPNSCSELDSNSLNRPKFYDYCADNCISQPPPNPCDYQKIGANNVQAGQTESGNSNVKIVKVTNAELVLRNFGQTTVNISGWTFVDPYFLGQDKSILFKSGLSQCKQRIPTFILPQDQI